MKQKLRNLVLAIFPVATMPAGPALADSFDTLGFLQHCADQVPNVGYAIPMDKLCVSTSMKLCDLASDQLNEALCLSEVTGWLVEDVERMTVENGAHAGLSAQLQGSGMMAGLLERVEKPDCSEISISGVPSDLICDYAQALGEWHKTRIMVRNLRTDLTK